MCLGQGIWEALTSRRVYGVTHSRIQLDYEINGHPMGSVISCPNDAELHCRVTGTDRIGRIEIIENNEIIKAVIPERSKSADEEVTMKFKVEFGWGPDIRVFPDQTERNWRGQLVVEDGRLLSVEKCWSNFHQKITAQDDRSCQFDLTTYQTNASGKWMGSCVAANEGFIFEIRGNRKGQVRLEVNGQRYRFLIEELLADSRILAFEREADELIRSRYGEVTHYRNDPWWHNSYKIKIYQGCLKEDYTAEILEKITLKNKANYRIRVYQVNGDVAFSSPIFT